MRRFIVFFIILAVLITNFTVGCSLRGGTNLEDFSYLVKDNIKVFYSEAFYFAVNKYKIYLAALGENEFIIKDDYLLIKVDDSSVDGEIKRISNVKYYIEENKLHLGYEVSSFESSNSCESTSIYLMLKAPDEELNYVFVNSNQIRSFEGGVVVLENGVYGVVDGKMETIVPFEYELIKKAEWTKSEKTYYKAYKDEFIELWDSDSNMICGADQGYTDYYYINENKFIVECMTINENRKTYKISSIDGNGQNLGKSIDGILIWSDIAPFDNSNDEGIFSVCGPCGVIDSDLNVLYEPEYYSIKPVLESHDISGAVNYVMWYETFDQDGRYAGALANGEDLEEGYKG